VLFNGQPLANAEITATYDYYNYKTANAGNALRYRYGGQAGAARKSKISNPHDGLPADSRGDKDRAAPCNR
jgi:hypothetical protein